MNYPFSDIEIDKCRQKIFKALVGKFRNCQREDIEDAIQDALLKYSEAINKNDRIDRFNSLDIFNSWLYKVAENKLIDEQRRKNKLVHIESEDQTSNNDTPFGSFGKFIDEDVPFVECLMYYQDEYNIDNILRNFWEFVCKGNNWDEIEKLLLKKHHIEGIDLKTLADEINKSPNSLYQKNKRLKVEVREIMEKNKIIYITDLDY